MEEMMPQKRRRGRPKEKMGAGCDRSSGNYCRRSRPPGAGQTSF